MKNLERDRRRKKGAIGSQDGSFRTFERRTRGADGRSATCILVGGADVTVYSVCRLLGLSARDRAIKWRESSEAL